MSRIGKNPVVVPDKVEVAVNAAEILVKGPLGTLTQKASADVIVKVTEGKVTFEPASGSIQANAMSGTMRALVANMVRGVTETT